MMKSIGTLATTALIALAMQSCHKDDSGSSTPSNPDGFVNSASESQFFEKGSAFKDKTQSGSTRLNLGGSTSKSKMFGAFGLERVENFAGLTAIPSNKPSPSTSDAERCNLFKAEADDLTSSGDILGRTGKEESDLSIRENDSCASALKSVKVGFTTMLKMMPAQIEALKDADTRLAGCGLKIRKLDPNSATEAVGYEFTPEQQQENTDFAVTVRGAASNDDIALFMTARARASMKDDEGKDINVDLNGSLNNYGFIATNAFKSVADVSASFAMAQGSLTANINSEIFAGGLGANELAKILELQSIKANVQAADGRSQSMDVSMNLKVEELNATQVRIQGEVVADQQRQTFDMTLTKDKFGACTVKSVNQAKTAL